MTDRKRRNEIRNRLIEDAKGKVLLMGILNVTPDSFSDGGVHAETGAALSRARDMAGEGCDILDIGGESTRPGAQPVSEADEYRRTMPLVEAVSSEMEIPVSIDTYKAAIARNAAEKGAVIINDVWGMTRDADMAAVVAETGSLVVVTYNRGEKSEDINLVDDMRGFFDRSFEMARSAGIPREHIWLDPGVGFGKTLEQNFGVLRRLDVLQDYQVPVLAGLSRKSFIGLTLDRPVHGRLPGSVGANLAAVANGAGILRVHDVEAHRDALTMYNLISR